MGNSSIENLIADVVVPAVDGEFSYKIPARLSVSALAGTRVLVPFGRRRMTGYLVRSRPAIDHKATKEIEHVIDDRPVFSPSMLEFTRWVSEYYLCPWGDVLKAALPSGMSLDERNYYALNAEPTNLDGLQFEDPDSDVGRLLAALRQGPLLSDRLRRQFGLTSRSPVVRKLRERGLVAFRPVLRAPRVKSQFDSVVTLSETMRSRYGRALLTELRSTHERNLLKEVFDAGQDGILRSDLIKGAQSGRRAAFARLVQHGLLDTRAEEVSRWDPRNEVIPDLVEPESLTNEQQAAVDSIVSAVDESRFETFLLFGVTGSGKTQVYIDAIRHTLACGKTALVLLPEIALTPFVWGRFYKVFGDRVAIQHSAQSPAVRYDLWMGILKGKYPVVIGARSAVFAPLENLGLIVVDEEQEGSFKQEEPAPRYHARDAALVRARMSNSAVVLGSATPSVESMFHAMSGRYHMLRLPERVGGSVQPKVEVVSWRDDNGQSEDDESDRSARSSAKKVRTHVRELPILTPELQAAISRSLDRHRQVVLLQNRRGYAPFLTCAHCANLLLCPNCSVSLTFHRQGSILRCHYCDHREPVPDTCSRCGSSDFNSHGLGTQRLEDEVAMVFPRARVLRMDSDTASRRGVHGRMVADFAAGRYDVLVGTQMIAKGLDFPNVELAAVVQADTELFLPDFRASERGASLILQVSGRAGRRTDPGTVIIQSNVPDHPVMTTAISGDWEALAVSELRHREQSEFPPYARVVLLRSVSNDETAGVKALLRVRRLLNEHDVNDVLGPAPALIPRMKNRYRHQILARSTRTDDPSGRRLRIAVRRALSDYQEARPEKSVQLEVDVDPQSVA